MYSIKPIDAQIIYQSAIETGLIITIEEHNVIGGLGSAVSEVTSENYPVLVKRMGISDIFGESARDEEIEELLDKYGLTYNQIVEVVLETRRKTKK